MDPADGCGARTGRRVVTPPATGDTRPTVLRVIARLNGGGPAMHVVLLQTGLDERRYRSLLATGRIEENEAEMSYFATERGVHPIPIPTLRRSISLVDDTRAALALHHLMRRERPAVVHSHTAKAGALARPISFALGVPVRVHTFHGHVFEGYFSARQNALIIQAERALARISDAIVTISEAQREDIVERFKIAPREKVHLVPLGLDLTRFLTAETHSGALRRELGLPPDGFPRLIGAVGRLVPIKRYEFFLQMLVELRRLPGCGDVAGVLVGSGECEGSLRALAAKLDLTRADRFGPGIHFLGWRRDIERILPDLEVIVSSSKNEGTPVAFIEAAVAGRPILARPVGGVSDTLGGGRYGRLVPDPVGDDPRAFASVVAEALAEGIPPLPLELRHEVVERYGAGRLCEELADLYDRLLARHAARVR